MRIYSTSPKIKIGKVTWLFLILASGVKTAIRTGRRFGSSFLLQKIFTLPPPSGAPAWFPVAAKHRGKTLLTEGGLSPSAERFRLPHSLSLLLYLRILCAAKSYFQFRVFPAYQRFRPLVPPGLVGDRVGTRPPPSQSVSRCPFGRVNRVGTRPPVLHDAVVRELAVSPDGLYDKYTALQASGVVPSLVKLEDGGIAAGTDAPTVDLFIFRPCRLMA